MKQRIDRVAITGRERKFTDITDEVQNFVAGTGVKSGLLTLFIQHTSASLLIQENADPDVLKDLDDAFARLAPRNANYRHRTEGPDDMPSHIRAAYLFEHRDAPHHRTVVMHVIGED
jgi:secondary thiamine-phosphate synthase enzyme